MANDEVTEKLFEVENDYLQLSGRRRAIVHTLNIGNEDDNTEEAIHQIDTPLEMSERRRSSQKFPK